MFLLSPNNLETIVPVSKTLLQFNAKRRPMKCFSAPALFLIST